MEGRMFKIEELKVFVNERLHVAAAEILGVVEKTIADYEEQASRLKRESDRQRALLNIVLRPRLPQREAGHISTTTTTSTNTATAPAVAAPVSAGVSHTRRANGSPCYSTELCCAFTSRTNFLRFAANGNCPYCFKRTVATETHLIKKHYLFAIHYTENGIGKFIVPCTCKDRIQGRSHWHCPNCSKIIHRKHNFEVHLYKQHGYVIQQQIQEGTAVHQPSVSICEEEEEVPPEAWCEQEFSSLVKEDQQPSLPLAVKEEQEELWVSRGEKHSPVMHPEWPSLEHLQIKEEQIEACYGQAGKPLQSLQEDLAKNSLFTIACVESLLQDSALAIHCGQIDNRESSEHRPLPTSSAEAVDPQIDRGLCQVSEPAGKSWLPTEDCTVSENGIRSMDEASKKSSGSGTGLKTLMSKKAKLVKRHRYCNSMKKTKSVRLSAWQRPTGPHCCKACGKSFHYIYTLRAHAQTHTVDKLQICGLCGKHLESTQRLIQHLRTHVETNKSYKCGKCFSSNFLKLHRSFHKLKNLDVIQ